MSNPPTKTKREEFVLGYLDRTEGKERSENPYPWIRGKSRENAKKIYWDNGWDKADMKLGDQTQ